MTRIKKHLSSSEETRDPPIGKCTASPPGSKSIKELIFTSPVTLKSFRLGVFATDPFCDESIF